jgi:hypothetical protein
MRQEGKNLRINEQNLCIIVMYLYNEEVSVVPNHPIPSVRQRTELTGRKIMAFRIGKM